ncbi:MAG: hypothetical protein KBB09_02265, partial [Firmicutes bacterium]|nr:hypothetical protein [Bacillota bacterium]
MSKTRTILIILMSLALVALVAGTSLASSITLEKTTVPASAIYRVGDTITYNLLVANPGTFTNTLDRVWDILPDGSEHTIVTNLVQGPGESNTYQINYTVREQDLIFFGGAWRVLNKLWATGSDSDFDTIYAQASKNNIVIRPSIDIEKLVNDNDADTSPGISVLEGSNLEFKFIVKNTGDCQLTNVMVTDDVFHYIGGPIILEPNDGQPGGWDEYTFTINRTATAGDHVNVATVTGHPIVGPDVTDTDPAYYFGANPKLSIVKTGAWVDGDADGYADVGEAINYTFAVKNEGNVTLHNVTVTDPKVAVAGGPTTLDVGETDSTTFTGVYYITQADIDAGHFYNMATADSDESGPDDDEEDVMLPKNPKLSIVKTGAWVDGDADGYADVGEAINYTFAVKNEGNVTLH